MLLLLLSFSSLTSISSQDKSCKSFDVYENGRKLKNPFSGGLNAPQFNQMDINQDGFEDIIVYERSTGQLSIYLYENGQYIFTCDYNEVFPAVNSWMFLSDYNGDGLKDLFTSPKYSSSPHIELWKACKTPDGICFEKLRFPYGTGDILSYYYLGNYFGVYVAKPDFPAIVDVDHDGDLDILSFEPGGGTVNWYKNISVESGISPDSFKLVLQDRCWAKFRESPFDETILLSDNPENCADWSGNFRHAESTINLLDMDGDLDYDIILGDSEFDGLIYIENGKITSDWGTKIIRPFPEGENQVKLRWFLGSYNIDVDLDGKPDLVVAPNAQYGAGNKDNVFFLKDIGIPPKKDFELRQKNFLQDGMIDWGSQIYPVLTDYDRDGLVDLILGTSGLIDNNGDISPKIVYYRNTGTRHQPEFSLMTDNMFSANTLGYQVLVPAIGDLDGDGDDDLIIGTEDGNLIYFENLAGPGKLPDFADPVFNFMDINVVNNAIPTITDINGDGLGDLLIGNARSFVFGGKTGSFACFVNAGTLNNPFFNSDWGHPLNIVPFSDIRLYQNNFNLQSFAHACFFKNDHLHLLFTGCAKGIISVFESVDYGLNPYLLQTDTLNGLDFGDFAAPALYDLDDDGYLDLLVGTEAGGLRLFNTTILVKPLHTTGPTDQSPKYFVLPNPVRNTFTINSPNQSNYHKPLHIMVSDQTGRHVISLKLLSENEVVDVSFLKSGMYFVRIDDGNEVNFAKLVKL